MASPESALVSNLTDEEFERRTLDAIQREFGLGGLARFIMTYRSGRGDYTADRHQWLAGVTIEDIERELKTHSAT
jgi:hypothetical protein